MGKPAPIPCKVKFRYKDLLPDIFVETYYRAWPVDVSHIPRCARYPSGVILGKQAEMGETVENVRRDGELITYALGSTTLNDEVELWEIWFSHPTAEEIALLPPKAD